MTDINANIHHLSPSPAPADIASRQQGAGYVRLMTVTPPAPCGVRPAITANRILRLPEVIARVGLRRASIYQHMTAGTFPKSITLGLRAVGWLESEIDAWLAVRIQARQVFKK